MPDPWQTAMRQQNFEAAFAINDAVLRRRDRATRDDPGRPYHERWVWDGRPVDGREVIVRCYHGLGDTVMFARFLSALRRRARSVVLETQLPLVPLLQAQSWADEVHGFRPERPLPAGEVDVEIMELSHALRAAPTPDPYLRRPASPRPHGLRAGLCWQSNPTWRPERSATAADVAPLLSTPDVAFVSLQRFAHAFPPGLADDCPSEVLETARRIAALDLVISVDTFVAHLAGAMGVPVWLLLDHTPDWRWPEAGPSAWYAALQTYRQPRPGDWTDPVSRIRRDLGAAAITRRAAA